MADTKRKALGEKTERKDRNGLYSYNFTLHKEKDKDLVEFLEGRAITGTVKEGLRKLKNNTGDNISIGQEEFKQMLSMMLAGNSAPQNNVSLNELFKNDHNAPQPQASETSSETVADTTEEKTEELNSKTASNNEPKEKTKEDIKKITVGTKKASALEDRFKRR